MTRTEFKGKALESHIEATGQIFARLLTADGKQVKYFGYMGDSYDEASIEVNGNNVAGVTGEYDSTPGYYCDGSGMYLFAVPDLYDGDAGVRIGVRIEGAEAVIFYEKEDDG